VVAGIAEEHEQLDRGVGAAAQGVREGGPQQTEGIGGVAGSQLDQGPEQDGVDVGRWIAEVDAFGEVQALDGTGGIPAVPGGRCGRDETTSLNRDRAGSAGRPW
jgi:hypothetical protein